MIIWLWFWDIKAFLRYDFPQLHNGGAQTEHIVRLLATTERAGVRVTKEMVDAWLKHEDETPAS